MATIPVAADLANSCYCGVFWRPAVGLRYRICSARCGVSSAMIAGPISAVGMRGSVIIGSPGSRLSPSSTRLGGLPVGADARRHPQRRPQRASPVVAPPPRCCTDHAVSTESTAGADRASVASALTMSGPSGIASGPRACAASSLASRAGSSSASVTMTSAARAGSRSSSMMARASPASGPLRHHVQNRLRDAQHQRGVAARGSVEHDQVVARSSVLHLGRVPPGLAQQRVGVEPRDRAQQAAHGAVLEHGARDQLGAQHLEAVFVQRARRRDVDAVDAGRQRRDRRRRAAGSARTCARADRSRRRRPAARASRRRRPRRASVAATVVRPTPPLPETITKRRSVSLLKRSVRPLCRPRVGSARVRARSRPARRSRRPRRRPAPGRS